MKKIGLILIVSFVLTILICNFVSASLINLNFNFNYDNAKGKLEKNLAIKSPVIKSMTIFAGVYIFGMYDIEGISQEYSITTAIILFVLIWLILFVGLSDALVIISPFSTWVSWIIGGAMSIIIANIGAIQYFVTFVVVILGFLGAVAIFIAIGMAFIIFMGLGWGAKWALEKKAAWAAHKGRTDISQGIQTFLQAGRQTQE